MVKARSVYVITNNTPYLAPMGELWGVYDDFRENNDSVVMAQHYIFKKTDHV